MNSIFTTIPVVFDAVCPVFLFLLAKKSVGLEKNHKILLDHNPSFFFWKEDFHRCSSKICSRSEQVTQASKLMQVSRETRFSRTSTSKLKVTGIRNIKFFWIKIIKFLLFFLASRLTSTPVNLAKTKLKENLVSFRLKLEMNTKNKLSF